MRHLLLLMMAIVMFASPARALSPIETFRLENGLEVLLVTSHAVPMVRVKVAVRAGSAQDPVAGVASLTASMLTEGAGELDSDALQERLQFHGISLGAEADREMIEVSLTTLTQHLDEAFARLADLLKKPRLEAKDFDRIREEHLAGLLKEKEDPESRAEKALMKLIYGDHPYAHPVDGDEESVGKITLEEIKAFHAAAFRAPNMVLAVAGDMERDELEALLEKYLADLNPVPAPLVAIPQAVGMGQGKSRHIRMDLPQTTYRFGLVGLSRQDPEYYAAYLMNHLLGGGDSSRLFQEVREKRGLTYGVFSYFSPLSAEGPFVIGVQTKTRSAALARRVIRDEMRKLAREGPTDEQMADAKLYLTGSFPLRLDGLGKLVSYLATIGFYDLGLDYLEQWPARIQAVTREEVVGVARRFLSLYSLNEVSVGK